MNHEAFKRKLWARHLASLPAKPEPEPEPEPTPEPTNKEPSAWSKTAQGQWYMKNREKVAEYHRQWRDAHPMTDEERARKRARDKARYRTDEEYRERKKAQQKARRARIKSDPVAYAALLERERAERRRHREKVLAERGAA